MLQPDKFLIPEADGLPTRPSHDYARYKWNALSYYLNITNTAMRQKWTERYYVDLQSGPGKNHIGNEIFLGSPLIALTVPYPATQLRFNELDPKRKDALEQRINSSPYADRVRISQADLNEIVKPICQEINEQDKKRATLNVAFLDPEGLELEWSTVEQLALVKRMDLIINFSTSGLVRTIGAGKFDVVNRYFGTDKWREIDTHSTNSAARRRALIDFYRQNLEKFGYHIAIDPNLGGDDIAFNNSKNSQVYSLIFASKHEIGDKFWRQAAKSVKPPRLPGF